MPLEHYIRRAMPFHLIPDLPAKIFPESSWIQPPTLRRGVKNRVIVYSGCFNPPHIGHKQVLTHAFFRSAYPDVVAAIVLPAGSQSVENKMAYYKRRARESGDQQTGQAGSGLENAVFRLSERAKLWKDDLLHPWCWIFEYEEEFTDVFSTLENDAHEDGFRVDFVMIGGTDHVNDAGGCAFWACGTQKVIIGNFFRPAPFIEGIDRVKNLDACLPWERCEESPEQTLLKRVDEGDLGMVEVLLLLYPDEKQHVDEITQKAEQQSAAAIKGPFREILERRLAQSGTSWICESKELIGPEMQFLPISGTMDKPSGIDISSTAVRKAIAGTTLDKAISMLQGVVLNADLLMEMLNERISNNHGEQE